MTTNEIALARREVESQTELHDSLQFIEAFTIINQEDQEFAAQVLREVKEKYTELEKKRTSITKPMNVALREVNNLFRPIKEALERGEKLLKRKIADYQLEQEQRNTAALQAAAAAAEPEEAQEALAEVEVVESPKGVNVRYVWRAKIVNEDLLPREYLTPDVRKIEAHARDAGDAEPFAIPGVLFEKSPIVSSRATSG